jgi:predicted amidohydrolase
MLTTKNRHWAWLLLVGCLVSPSLAAEHDVVLSVYQGVCAEGDFEANLATVKQQVEEAKRRGSHFVVFPECFLSGYENREVVERGARGLDDPALLQFIAESSNHDMVVLVGMARRATDGLYNTELVIHGGKLMGFFDKVVLTPGDRDVLGFQPGTAVPIFQAHGVRFAVIICADTSYPHVAMAARLQGAEILFTPHFNEIGTVAMDDHRRWVRNCHVGLASQFKMVVARANNVKSSRVDQLGYGDSFILSPQGTPLAEADLFKSELITATVGPDMFRWPWVWGDMNDAPSWLRAQLGQMLTDFRRPTDEQELKSWLENMAVYHRFSLSEISTATGLTLAEVNAALRESGLVNATAPRRSAGEPLLVLPYPGGRHPRLGFFEGAVMPQRETKVSVFTPWPEGGYMVVDVPEAIFSNLGLTYLAHTHIPTIWDRQGIALPRLEWQRHEDGTLHSERALPNGITFGAKIVPTATEVHMELWLRNGTTEKLTGLRVQNCIMLGYAPGFTQQTNDNKIYESPYAAARSDSGDRWVITAWEPVQRCWGNEKCPCLHSDPQFPDCAPGETKTLRGWLSFYEGADIQGELRRIEATGWRK